MRMFRLTTIVLLVLIVAAPLFAKAKITIVNADGAGEGFNDPAPAQPVGGNSGTTLGQQRLIAFQYAADIWGNLIDSDVEILVRATFDPLECSASSAVLGSAGPIQIFRDFPNAPLTGHWYHAALGNKLSGVDQAPEPGEDGADIRARFNSRLGQSGCLTGRGFYLGLDNNHGNNIDLVVVLLHEFAHGLGFSNFVRSDTGELAGDTADGFFPDVYTFFSLDNTTGKHWNQMTNAERRTSATNTGNLVWDGPKVTAAASRFLNSTVTLTVNTPPSVAGNYRTGIATFGPRIAAPLNGTLVQGLDEANASGSSTTDGCTALTNPSSVTGKIVLFDRGSCDFVIKARNAQNAGAIAMVIAETEEGTVPAPLGGSDPSITIPSVRILRPDATKIRAEIANSVNLTLLPDPGSLVGADTSSRVRLFAPNPVQLGSSVSHWDTVTTPNLLMEPQINSDLSQGVDLTVALFEDIGWFNANGNVSADLADALLNDADGDGQADPGDTIRYTLTVKNISAPTASGLKFTLTPPAEAGVVSGSVTTSQGTVTRGNGAGDNTVEVELGSLQSSTLTVTFDLRVNSGIPSTATQLSVQGTVTGSNIKPTPTNDPATNVPDDATVTPLNLTPLSARKSDALTTDADSSDGFSRGDTVTYTITLRAGSTAVTSVVFDDTPDPNSTLVVGSVTTTQGTIVRGNTPGDTTVRVDVGTIANGTTATITLQAKAKSDVPSNIKAIFNQGTVTGTGFTTVTDDPEAGGTTDPTGTFFSLPRRRGARR